ncbi:MAG: S8 family serine peptidase [Pseudomonadota bacterium]
MARMLETACKSAGLPLADLKSALGEDVEVRERGSLQTVLAREIEGTVANRAAFRIQLTVSQGRVRRARAEFSALRAGRSPAPVLSLRADASCAIAGGRRILFDGAGRAQRLIDLGPDLGLTGTGELLNPPVPPGTDPGGVLVAHIDSGVNYTLPFIARRLARAPDGSILGHDFWDEDDRPYDVDSSRSPFFPLHHGTLVASVLLSEAPDVRLAPYRYPRNDMTRMTAVIRRINEAGARIVAMPLGGRKRSVWAKFIDAASAHPHILFVVSAGNDGRNIDEDPVYPASADLPNLLVVTSATVSGRLAQGSNWARESVDLMVPAERVEVIDHRGAKGRASGSSYAVPKIAALAARLLARNPEWRAPELKQAIMNLAAPSFDRSGPKTRWGWIPDPSDDG